MFLLLAKGKRAVTECCRSKEKGVSECHTQQNLISCLHNCMASINKDNVARMSVHLEVFPRYTCRKQQGECIPGKHSLREEWHKVLH